MRTPASTPKSFAIPAQACASADAPAASAGVDAATPTQMGGYDRRLSLLHSRHLPERAAGTTSQPIGGSPGGVSSDPLRALLEAIRMRRFGDRRLSL